MLQVNKDIYAKVRDVHAELHLLFQELRNMMPGMNMHELADTAYAMRESAKLAKDTFKSLEGIESLAEQLACAQFTLIPDTPDRPDNIKTEHCTATPRHKQVAKVPTLDKDAAAYHALMDYLGVDPVCRDQGTMLVAEGELPTEVLRVHWPGFQSLVTRLSAEGYALPAGVKPYETFTEFNLTIRKTKGVQE